MSLSPKKMAAISAAIRAYIEQQQQQQTRVAEAPVPNPWGYSGRQETMQMTILLQRRMARSVR